MTTTTTADDNTNNDIPKGGVLSRDQLAEWGDGTNFIEPRLQNEEGKEVRSVAREDLAKAQEAPEEEQEEEVEEEEPVVEEIEQEELPPLVTLEDPGDYTPTDYSFEVSILVGEEGKEREKKVKITSVADAEKLLEDDPNFGSAKNLLDFNRKVTKMETNGELERKDYDKRKAEYDKQVSEQQSRQDYIEGVAKEINYLVGKGKLPKVSAKYANADWSDPEIAKQPGVKEQNALLNYMVKENAARQKAGIAPFAGAVDAYNAMLVDTQVVKNTEAKKQAGEQRRAAGSRVAGGTPNPVTLAPKGISVGRGGSLRDLDSGWSNPGW